MTWNLACYEGGLFAGYAPIAGTFWAPVPRNCPSRPVSLVHFHGTRDTVVPLGGREIADSRQGVVGKALAFFARRGHFGPEKTDAAKGLHCKRRQNPKGKILELCIHSGGHGFKVDYIRRAWRVLHIADLRHGTL